MTYRVLVVDDERYIADATAMRLEAEEQLELQVRVAYSAAEALQAMQASNTDILVADIRMPGMDGLELTGRVRARWPMCRVILLTAHSEFEYAYQAIKHTPVDYVLKSEGYEALLSAVFQAVAQLESSELNRRILLRAQQQSQAALPLLRRELVKGLLDGVPYQPSTIERAQRELGFEVELSQPSLSCLALVGGLKPNVALYESMEHMGAICAAARLSLPEGVRMEQVQLDATRMLWLWQAEPPLSAGMARDLLERVQDVVRERFGLSASFAYSTDCAGWAQLGACYARLIRAMAGAAAQGGGMWLAYAGQQRALHPSPDALLARWRSAYESNDPSAQSLMEKMLDGLSNYGSTGERGFIKEYVSISLALTELLGEAGQEDVSRGLKEPAAHATPGQAADYLRALSLRAGELRGQNVGNATRALVFEVKRYILQHYAQDVSLGRLSEFAHMNASYLSRLFKQVTGENLNKYIVDVKLDAARRLLGDPLLKIADISQRLGFPNPTYFSFFFKRQLGLTPKAYRDQALSGNLSTHGHECK